MSLKFRSEQHYGSVTTSASNTVLIGPLDIRDYETFSIMYRNNNASAAFLDLQIQAALDPTTASGGEAPNWVQLNTTTLVQPSALGVSASVLSSAVQNAYAWIRLLGRTDVTATAGSYLIHIGGFGRF